MLRQSPFGKKQKYFKTVFFNFPHAAFILYTVHMSIAYLVCIFIEGLVNTLFVHKMMALHQCHTLSKMI